MSGISICLVLLAGCTIGHWNICGPQTPRAFCDKEAYEALVNPTPPSDDWSRADFSVETRAADWLTCGGLPTGGISPDRRGETGAETATLMRDKYYAAQRCMMSKGYQYIGTCEGDIPNRFPACQARSK